jgi:hypothetical protein
MGAARITTDHEEIRAWVERRGGTPAHVQATSEASSSGILCIDFPGYTAEEALEPMAWDEWFKAFDQHGLAFLHQDETESGSDSRFNKLVSRERIGSAVQGDLDTHKSKRRPSARRVRPAPH